MTIPGCEAERLAALEARVEALSSLTKSLLTTFVLRGTLFKADMQPLIDTAAQMLEENADKARVVAELDRIGAALPGYQRARMGPEQSDADHDH